MRVIYVLLLLLLLASLAAPVKGAIITVNQSTDPIDIDWQTATIEDLPGPNGRISFSEAIIAANNTPGRDTIHFTIPQNEWVFQFLFPGRAVVQSSYTFFWRAYEALVIDGRSQTAFTGDTNPNGAEVVLYGGEFYFNAGNSELYGLDGGSLNFGGNDNYASENTGNMNLSIFGGRGNVLENNILGTIKIDRSDSNTVISNTCSRIRIWGFSSSETAVGNVVGGVNVSDRNFILGYGTTNSEGLPSGHAIQLFWTENTLIENNRIGTTTDGLSQGNQFCSIGISFESGNRYVTVRNNLISGILGHGQGPHHAGQLFGRSIMLSGEATDIQIIDNVIGPDAQGNPTLGSVTGLDIGTYNYLGMDDIHIEGNIVAGHRLDGIAIGRSVTQTRLTQNLLFSNTRLGIDLIADNFATGVTPNDPLDTDIGGNGLQNFPVINSASSSGSSVSLAGSFNSYANSEFTLEFFASPMCHSTGHGEGQMYLGSVPVTTDGAGNASFEAQLLATVPANWVATATATREPNGVTSEFSTCVPIASAPCAEIPANLTIFVENGFATIQWEPTAQAVDYAVYAAFSSTGNFDLIGNSGGQTSFEDPNFADFDQRFYYVVAVCD